MRTSRCIIWLCAAVGMGAAFVILFAGCSFWGRYYDHMVTQRTGLDCVLEQALLTRRDIAPRTAVIPRVPLMLGSVKVLLETPATMVSCAEHIDQSLRCDSISLAETVAFAADMLDASVERRHPVADTTADLGVPEPLRELVCSLFDAHNLFLKAFEDLTREEILFIQQELSQYLVSGEERSDRTRREHQRQLERAFALASRINLQLIAQAGYCVAGAIDQTLPLLMKQAAALPPAKLHTALGDIVIGSMNNDLYTDAMPLLLVDPGGNDTYRFTRHTAVNVIIDLDGDDSYWATDASSPGAGLSGIGLVVDVHGNDQYTGQRYAQGVGFLGVGMVADLNGNDTYTAGMLAQGAATLGIGILYDRSGNDTYQLDLYGQGMGFTGGIGLLIDKGGNDTYTAGMTVADSREAHGAFQTYAQGFGMGVREFAAGGIGILYDGSGNDQFTGSYFCQGSGYWLGAGILVDRSGNDRYTARRYAQAAGIHDAAGILYEGSGDDEYNAWGVSQGCGHDFGVGMFIERGGNDRYEAQWLSQGAGSSAGCGLFFDENGNDGYCGNGDTLRGYGTYDDRRDMISVGLFIDRAGRDSFPSGAENARIWRRGEIGAGMVGDGSSVVLWKEPWQQKRTVRNAPVPVPEEDNKTQGITLPELEAPLFLEDSWERAATSLAARGPEVLPMLCTYADIKNVSVQRAIEETVKRLGRDHLAALHSFLMDKPCAKALPVLLFALGEIANKTSEPVFIHFLSNENPAVQALALRGLYKLSAPLPVQYHTIVRQSPSAAVRRFYALALGGQPDTYASATLCHLLEDSDLQVRFAAYRALRKQGGAALPSVRNVKPTLPTGSPAHLMLHDLFEKPLP